MKERMSKMKGFFHVRKHRIWIILSIALVTISVVGGIEIHRILYTPVSLFHLGSMKPLQTNVPSITSESSEAQQGPMSTQQAFPSSSPSSAAEPNSVNGTGILNILLIGISGRSGPDPHADGIMVVAINFDKKRVDLISLPRDTFIYVPDIMNGVYKLNASFNVGGGYNAKNGGGFLKVCEASQYLLGGIPINYYYAVNFDSVVNLVNTIGGVDYDVESAAYSQNGISGMQHMDGSDVLYYLGVRKVGPEQGDNNRVNRQKKMLVAVFDQLKENGKLSMIPGFLKSASSSVYTNLSLEQTLALLNFASTINTDTIGMHSMTGELHLKDSWGFVFTDQKARQDLIRQVYGIDVPELVHCSADYATWLGEHGFSGIVYLKTAKLVLDYADAHPTDLTSEGQTAYDKLKNIYNVTQDAYNRASLTLAKSDDEELVNDQGELKSATERLASLLGYNTELQWTYNPQYWNDPAINEVRVDFR